MTTISGLDVWSLISGVIGVFGVLPFMWAYVRSQHPETKLAELDSTLNDTEALLRSVIEEGLLHPVMHVPHFESRLKNFRAVAEKLRDDTFIASVEWRKLLRAWYDGLTKEISTVCAQVKGVRANICETSANARMRLTQESSNDPVPSSFQRRLRAKVTKFWKCITALARRSLQVCVADTAASITRDSATSHAVVASTEGAGSGTVVPDDELTPDSDSDTRHCHRASRKISNQWTKDTRASSYVPRTASRTYGLLVFSRAIRQVDRELTAEGVTNARLAQLVQATHKRWSPASSKARPPRRSRKLHSPVHRPEHILALQFEHASKSGMDSEVESSGEETMCEI